MAIKIKTLVLTPELEVRKQNTISFIEIPILMNEMNSSGEHDSASRSDPYTYSRCQDCGYANFPSSAVCPGCLSCNLENRPLSRNGILYSYSTMTVAESNHFVGYVDLPEEIRVFGRLTGIEANSRPECGIPVVLRSVEPAGKGPQFVFAPSQGERA